MKIAAPKEIPINFHFKSNLKVKITILYPHKSFLFFDIYLNYFETNLSSSVRYIQLPRFIKIVVLLDFIPSSMDKAPASSRKPAGKNWISAFPPINKDSHKKFIVTTATSTAIRMAKHLHFRLQH
jgi:hypothetical protein